MQKSRLIIQEENSMLHTITDNSGSVMDSRFNRNLNLTEYER